MDDKSRTTDDGLQTTGDASAVVGRLSSVVVIVAMLLFAVWFSAYSIRLHEAHRTHKADLGQIDLAIWNTAHGRFVQEIKDDQVSTRLTDHVEPIFLLVAPVFWLWDDVRALLILQAVALALGAWPIYLLARKKLSELALSTIDAAAPNVKRQTSEVTDHASLVIPAPLRSEDQRSHSSLVSWGAVIFALAYLLTPALQAAAVAEFHALALAPVFIAWALWAVESRRWGQFAIAAILLMCVQEGMALLAAVLGVYALIMARRGLATQPVRVRSQRGEIAGVAITLIGLAWFYVTTFVIIPHYAAQVYGLAQTPYAARYGALGDSFADVIKSFVTRPAVALSIAIEPARVRYLIGLLLPTAFLALLGPEILLLSLPLLLANLFSSFPMQFAGELHYSAPLVPYFTLAAMIGLRRFEAQARPVGGPRASLALSIALVAAGALAAQVLAGHTVVGREFRGWPQVTAHEGLLDRFAAQIPRDAALSATTDLYPHLSHRPLIYQFPWLGQAEWALVDVSGTTDRHPADIRREIGRLLETGWGVVDAADGYILLGKGRGAAALPDAFYDFARAPAVQPEFPLDITFGDRLKLVGYDLVDDAKWRRTALRFYWQALAPLSEDTAISVQAVAPDGSEVGEAAPEAMPALLWYPPVRWQPGETVAVETLPAFLPRAWAPLIGVAAGGKALPPQIGAGSEPPEAQTTAEGRVLLAPWERQGGWLGRFVEPREKYPLPARFAGDNWAVRLTDIAVRSSAAPGRDYPVVLRWAAEGGPASRDYRVFVHLRDAAGKTVATGDGTPTWFAPSPTNRWSSGQSMWDAHAVAIPADVTPGEYKLVIGWYDPETGKRLSASSADGNAQGNEYVIGRVAVYPLVGSRPDLACLMTPAACASQE